MFVHLVVSENLTNINRQAEFHFIVFIMHILVIGDTGSHDNAESFWFDQMTWSGATCMLIKILGKVLKCLSY